MSELIHVVGLSDSLSSEARALIDQAEVLAGGKRELAEIEQRNAERIVVAAPAAEAISAIRQAADGGKRVVVLASGDPLLFGIGASLVREVGRDRVRMLPAISSVHLAFARLGEPWHDASVLSAHGRPLPSIIPIALASTKAAILTDGQNTPSAIAGALIDAGMEDCRAVVAERLGCTDERILETGLHALPGQNFDPLNVLLLFREPGQVRLRFGSADESFEVIRGQITKAEVRAVALSKLRLAPDGVLWDVGAGSGSVAIEAALLMPRGAVYAIERDAEQQACLARNIARHGATNVKVVAGEAPEILACLPAPDCVFIGGAGGRLSELLEVAPRPFVINLAMPEHLTQVLQRFPDSEFVQLSVGRSEPIGDGHRMAALNPVFVVTVPA